MPPGQILLSFLEFVESIWDSDTAITVKAGAIWGVSKPSPIVFTRTSTFRAAVPPPAPRTTTAGLFRAALAALGSPPWLSHPLPPGEGASHAPCLKEIFPCRKSTCFGMEEKGGRPVTAAPWNCRAAVFSKVLSGQTIAEFLRSLGGQGKSTPRCLVHLTYFSPLSFKSALHLSLLPFGLDFYFMK